MHHDTDIPPIITNTNFLTLAPSMILRLAYQINRSTSFPVFMKIAVYLTKKDDSNF